MRVSMKLEIQDRPGQLVAALTPISDVGANIIAVIHQRDQVQDLDVIDVQVVIDIPRDLLDDLLERLNQRNVKVVRMGEEHLLFTHHIIMIGHIVQTDLGDTLDQIDRSGLAEVTELSLVMPAIAEPSSARLTIRAPSQENMDRALAILTAVAEEKNLVLIEPLEESS
ncbi:MAG: amino acid-binding protein [Methanoculleaceae archaeon]